MNRNATPLGDSAAPVPAGWSLRVVNEVPLLLGEWRTFTFGRNLRLAPAEHVWAPSRVETRALREENVETLMLLNVDVLFPGYRPALCGKSLRDWSGADIEFTDPSGCRHVIEVKFGARANHVIDQALSYALDVIPEAATMSRHFHELSAADRHRFLACRTGGFWTQTRADKWPRLKALPPAERDWDALRRQLSAHAGLGLDELACRTLATTLEHSWPAPPTIPARPNAVHFHLAVPEPSKIHRDQLYALARLRWRGHRASIWQIAAQLDASGGRFSIRECWVPPADTGLAAWHGPGRTNPQKFRIGEVLATMAAIDPDLIRQLPVATHARGESVSIGDAWHGAFPCSTLSVRTEQGRPCLRIGAWVVNPESLEAQHGSRASEVRRTRHEAIAGWVLSVAPPRDEGLARRVAGLHRSPHRWGVVDPSTKTEIRVWHSGGLSTASMETPIDNLDAAASFAARALRSLMEHGQRRKDGFGPGVVAL